MSEDSNPGEKKSSGINLSVLREQIDHLDASILKSLSDRQEIVRKVISSKIDSVKEVRDPKREEQLLAKIRRMAREVNLDPYFAEQLFRDVIFQSVRYQTHTLVDHQNKQNASRQIRVGYQGAAAAFSYQAAERHFEERYSDIRYIGFHTFEEAIQALENDQVDVAILPIENTTAGSINETYDIVARDHLHIIGEEVLRVHHVLAGVDEVDPQHIRRIIAHPLTISQCSGYLSALPRVSIESFTDSGMAARKVRDDDDLSQAALISPYAADHYGLKVIDPHPANHDEIYTRFVVISKDKIVSDPQFPSKISLLLTTVHERGALFSCLKVLDEYGINMTKLESRPRSDKPWQYQFYLDIDGNTNEMKTQDALRDLESKAASLKILGCYPKQDVNG
jgi:chorismate mutase/prephenate dehydratase